MKGFMASCIVLFLLPGCKSSSRPTVEALSPRDFQTKLENSRDYILLDVRTPEEFAEGALDNAVNIDYYDPQFVEKIAALDKSRTIFVYCAKGGRSRIAVDSLKIQGFNSIYELKGGYDNWVSEDLPTIKPEP